MKGIVLSSSYNETDFHMCIECWEKKGKIQCELTEASVAATGRTDRMTKTFVDDLDKCMICGKKKEDYN